MTWQPAYPTAAGPSPAAGALGGDLTKGFGAEAAPTASLRQETYGQILRIFQAANDLGLDNVAKQRVEEALSGAPEQAELSVRQLLASKVITRIQLARAMARVNKMRELMSVLDIPPEGFALRQQLHPKLKTLLRAERIVPISQVKDEGGQLTDFHVAHDSPIPDLVVEAKILEFFTAELKLHWHFALREVAGAYWLSGESETIDAGMEAEALLDRLISNAIDSRSSDIHIDPSIKGEPRAVVKYRIDGFVHPKEVITLEQLDRLRVRIENLARMPKVNLNHANKGAFSRSGYDWRVQIQPHAGRQGPVPRIVIRRLQPEVMPLEALGYPTDFIEKAKTAASAPNGVIFWTGPTGSGKTESIHAAVVSVNPMAKGLSVHTIEDPPEKRVPGYAVQMEIAADDPSRTGLQLMKSSLRADPDVVIFGEVRDHEMASLVFEAANTGHLVFTTLHTNTAIDSIARLAELGIKGFLLSYIRGIAAQRLVRRLCTHCKLKMDTPDEYTRYVFDRYQVSLDGADLHVANPEGCASCNFTGYYGRIAVAEWLKPSKEIIEASEAENYTGLEDMAKRAGWQPMGRMGVLHIKRGITDAAELSTKILELSAETLTK
jgi:type II secretory ATPase GspE/PulE/Tfp pilus assembly ATPase PilB-like protein